MNTHVRVRFAPSPTGLLHVGNARTAVYNKLFAVQHDGTFILRIEDTDIERLDPASEQAIMEDLQWMGLTWAEGPDTNGECGPYRQSERIEFYRTKADQLLAQGQAYRCYCTDKELADMRSRLLDKGQRPRYTGRCKGLTAEQISRREHEGRRPSVRFNVPPGVTILSDLIHGTKTFDNHLMGDFVILRSDGRPAYNFAAVVDDSAMEITHVIRGEDHLPNTPRQLLLYAALGSATPVFAHHPMLLGPDGTRLSKRHGATSVRAYRDEGFLPQAMTNYLALLGSGISGETEVLSWEDMIHRFSLEGMARSPAIFDPGKLRWLNRMHLRAMDGATLYAMAHSFFEGLARDTLSPERWTRVMEITRENVETLKDFTLYLPVFLDGAFDWDHEALQVLADPAALEVVKSFTEMVGARREVTPENIEDIIRQVKTHTQRSGKGLYAPIRAAVTGRTEGPQLHDVLLFLGKNTILTRVKDLMHRKEQRSWH